MSSRLSLIALAVSVALPTVAAAVDFSYSGFGTAAYSQTDTNDAQVGYIGQPEGIDKDGSFEIDSKVGLQVTARFNELISATVQGVAYTDLSGDWEPRLDWAYLRLQALSNLNLRAGYLRAPTFMYSDSVYLGYANTWVRPPMEVYGMAPVYQLRGIDATWSSHIGAFIVSVNPYYGDGEVDLVGETLDVSDWVGLATTVSYGSWQARVGYSEVELGTTNKKLVPLVNALRDMPSVFCGACAREADRLDLDGAVVKSFNVGVQYDDGRNLLATEYASLRTGGSYVFPTRYGAYATYGRRFGSVMPYVTYAFQRRDEVTHSDAVPAVGMLAALNAGINASLSTGATDQDSYGVGVRYELPSFSVVKGALVKLQFDHIDADGNGNLINVQPRFDGELNMVSVSFDLIF
jgi:hypothetical protein